MSGQAPPTLVADPGLSIAELRRQLVERRLRGANRPEPMPAAAVPVAPSDRPVPLSPAQERLYLLDRLRPGGTEYLIPLAYRLAGRLDVGALRGALGEVVNRHAILRTRYIELDGRPRQVVDPWRPLDLPMHDGTDVAAVFAAEGARPFDLAEQWPIRATLVRVAAEEHVLLLCVHHIAFDGWSADLLYCELAKLYPALAAGRAAALPPVARQYADHAAWQRASSDATTGADLEYWRRQLDGLAVWEAPLDRPRPAEWDATGRLVRFAVPAEVAGPLLAAGERRDATAFVTLLAAYQAFLARRWGLTDVGVGVPVAGRSRPEIAGTIGYFANTVVLRAQVDRSASFDQAVDLAQAVTLDALAHQELPFGQLVDALRPAHGLSTSLAVNPLFQTMLTVGERPAGPDRLGDLAVEPLAVDWAAARFDLALDLTPRPDGGLDGTFVYPTALFDASTVERLAAGFVAFYRAAGQAAAAALSTLDSMAPEERDRLLVMSTGDVVARAEETLPDLVERQAAATPAATAVVSGGERLTYVELDQRANQLAHHLRSLGIGAESRVAVCMHRAPELVVALLGVVKAGAAYVPVDPEYPAERIAYLLADADAAVTLTQTAHLDLVPDGICLDNADLYGYPKTAPPRHLDGDHAAYVIYTSGSTGHPKGVVNTHRAIVNRLAWMQSAHQLDVSDVVLQKTPFAFDVSVWEFFWPLATGAALVLAEPGGHRDGAYLRDTVIEHGVTVCHFVPSMLRAFLDVPRIGGCTSLRDVICSGEALTADLVRGFANRIGARLHNLYGPTEAAIDVTSWPCDPADGLVVPIGGPIDNLRTYVLDEHLALAPIGTPGELYLGGVGLARGYLGKPALTAERFVSDPFGPPGGRLYRTGDRVRWQERGAIEFLGRLDHQVKVAGHRIELGEIEAVLLEHPGVAAAVVVVHDERLLAYVVPAEDEVPGVDLRAWLGRRLPAYLVPRRYVTLARLPLSPHGKVDRSALPAPGAARADVGASAPSTPLEATIAQVWSTVLGVPAVGADGGFFDLGGDSIRALQAVGLLRQAGVEVAVRDLFRQQSPAALAARLTAAKAGPPDALGPPGGTGEEAGVAPFALVSAADRAALPDGVTDAYPLSMVQAGMVYEMLGAEPLHPYHNVTVYLVTDDGPFSLPALRVAAQRLVARHEPLRTSFDLTSYGESLQLVHASAKLEIAVEDLRELPAAEQDALAEVAVARARGQLFDLARPPLVRLYVHLLADDRWRLGWVECHPILDGWSHNSLVSELLAGYRDARAAHAAEDGPMGGDGPVDGPPAGDAPTGRSLAAAGEPRFADFIALERRTLNDPAAREVWRRRLDEHPPLRLPAAWADPAATEMFPYDLRVPTGDLLPGLRRLARAAGAPLKSVLLAAHLTVLRMITDEPTFHTGLATNGRPEVYGSDRVAGMYLNLVPFAAPGAALTWRELVRDVFAAEAELWPYRRYPAPAMQREFAGGTPFIEVLFNYLDFHVLDGTAVDIAGTADYSPTELPLVVSTEPEAMVLSVAPGRIARPYAEALRRLYAGVLAAMAADPDGDPLAYRPPTEAHARGWTNSVWKAPDGRIDDLFAAQVAATPGAIAVRFAADQLTYAELDRRADRLARVLREHGAGPDQVIGICLDRSIELVVAILAVVKAGAAYLAVDPADPPARRVFQLTDAGVELLVGADEPALPDGVCTIRPDASGRIVRPAPADAPSSDSADAPSAVPAGAGGDLAYLIYTSGSTGQPKAVAATHRNVVQLVTGQWYARMGPGTVHLLHSPVTFDAATYEIWGALLTGGELVVAPPGHLLPEDLRAVLDRYQVTALFMTATLFMLMIEHDVSIFAGLRQLLFGGEAMDPAYAARAAAALPDLWLANVYGPTETTTFATCHPLAGVPAERIAAAPVPIGRPIRHTEAYIQDAVGRPVPVGVPGELYLGGPSVARGYLGRPALTAEKFVPHPYSPVPGARLYRTGDRACWLADGEIQFLGRIDHQIKLSGHRIEPGEIEAAIAAYPGVRQVAVVAHRFGPGDQRLVAYVRVDAGTPAVTPAAMHAALRTKLPESMLPAAFVVLPEFPLTSSGKINRRALPVPQLARPEAAGYVPPRTAVEERIARVWAAMLGLPRVGVEDDFIGLGGHSLIAMRAAARLQQDEGLSVHVRDVLGLRTVAAVAAEMLVRAGTGRADPTPGSTRHHTGHRSLVWFQPAGTRRPAFLVHPGGGSVHWYRDLVALLPPDLPVAALQHPGLAEPDRAGLPIEALGEVYLAEVREAQPTGPYRIFGWCSGTAVTWELARLLVGAGEDVSVALLDPTLPGEEPPEHLSLLWRAEQLFAELDAAPAEAASALRTELAAVLTTLVEADGEPVPAEEVDSCWLTRVRIWRGQSEAVRAYRLPPAAAPTCIALTEDLTLGAHEAMGGHDYTAYVNRWRELAGPNLPVTHLAGTHLGVLTPPHVRVLADHLTAWLDEGNRTLPDERDRI